MNRLLIFLIAVLAVQPQAKAQSIFLEAEGFADIGGWTNDNQSMTRMGSPYLIAHGLGRPVADAETDFEAPEAGEYRLWVRTRDWTRTWGRTESPGRFQVIINGKPSEETFGTKTEEWAWQDGGSVILNKGENKIALHDLTGFEGRCDAIFLTKDLDSEAPEPTADFRRKALGIKASALRLRSGTWNGDGTARRLRSGTGNGSGTALRLRSGTGEEDGTGFPDCPWAIQFSDSTCIPTVHGE